VLNAALLSKDKAPGRAVYGETHDHVAHAQWRGELSAVGDLGPLGRLVHALNALLASLPKVSSTGSPLLLAACRGRGS
jgi:hypothetical protein